jgi:hypothetical protein
MKYNKLGQSELRVSEICLGTMTLNSVDVTLSPDVLAAVEQVHARYPNPAP